MVEWKDIQVFVQCLSLSKSVNDIDKLGKAPYLPKFYIFIRLFEQIKMADSQEDR